MACLQFPSFWAWLILQLQLSFWGQHQNITGCSVWSNVGFIFWHYGRLDVNLKVGEICITLQNFAGLPVNFICLFWLHVLQELWGWFLLLYREVRFIFIGVWLKVFLHYLWLVWKMRWFCMIFLIWQMHLFIWLRAQLLGQWDGGHQ